MIILAGDITGRAVSDAPSQAISIALILTPLDHKCKEWLLDQKAWNKVKFGIDALSFQSHVDNLI